MGTPDREAVLARLRQTITGMERRRPLEAAGGLARSRAPGDTHAPFAGLDADAIHEIWAPSYRDTGPAFGFALGQASAFLGAARPALLWIQRAHEAREVGVPYALGFPAFGVPHGAVTLVRTGSVTEMLWASEEAASSSAVAAVIVESFAHPKALDFTASRRLSLRAGQSGTPVLILRYGLDREASAARTRWRVEAAPGPGHAYDANAPGPLYWHVALEKAPHGQKGAWTLFWTGTRFASAFSSTPVADNGSHIRPANAVRNPPASGAYASAVGHGLPETG